MIALDLETTGLTLKNDSVIEIAAVRFEGTEILEKLDIYVDPQRAIPPNITQLTHITNAMVAGKPTLREVIPQVEAFIGNETILGHSVDFDLGFMRQAGILLKNASVDTFELANVLLPCAPRYKLGALAEYLGIEINARELHGALYDTVTTIAVYNALLQKARELPFDLLNKLVAVGMESHWNGLPVLRQILSERLKAGEAKAGGGFKLPTYSPRWDTAECELKPSDTPQALDTDALAAMIEPGGTFSKVSERFEPRAQQVNMLRRVCDAFSNGHHMLIEAGTGTGKSFAYLIPSFQWALQNGERVVVSTNTINLQEQLMKKDIPQLERMMNTELRATVQKGRGNYFCPRRLMNMLSRGAQTPNEMRVLGKFIVWLSSPNKGDRAEINLNGPVDMDLWQHLSADNEGCMRKQCEYVRKNQCPYYTIRNDAEHSHVIIVNHALLLRDARLQSGGVLPEYKHLVIDEAHHLEEAATSAMSFHTNLFELTRLLQDIGTSHSGVLGRALTELQDQLSNSSYDALKAYAESIEQETDPSAAALKDLFRAIGVFMEDRRENRPVSPYGQSERLTEDVRRDSLWLEIENAWEGANDSLSRMLSACDNFIKRVSADAGDNLPAEANEAMGLFAGAGKKLEEAVREMDTLFMNPSYNSVYWFDISARGVTVSLNAAPLSIGSIIQEKLWYPKDSVILTSATLTAGNDFDYIRERLSADTADEFIVGSPFDYEKNVLLYLPNDIPDPSAPTHQAYLEKTLINLVKAVGGRTLVLFTSYKNLKATANAVSRPLAEAGITLFEQGEGVSAAALLETFRKTEKAVLMGTRSFWEGVDVQGEALSVVVIVKLPFDVPSDPIIAARSESFDEPFSQYSLPEAILKFRQGFGRLIRSKADRGVVLIFDTRVTRKSYGRIFLNSIPRCTTRSASVRELAASAARWIEGK